MKSCAKLNLALEVTGREQDGHHNLNTVMCILEDYYDLLEISNSSSLKIETTGKYSFKGENILEKTASLFKQQFGGDVNFSIKLTKNIKTGGGLGGGSSNAATFLHFLLKQNHIFLNKKAFCEFAFKIGADVPFFYDNKPKICTHFGEVLEDISFKIPKHLFALLVIPELPLNTGEVFSALKHTSFAPSQDFSSFERITSSVNSLTYTATQINPQIADIISQLRNIPNVLKADMSGSGSTCFAIFEKQEDCLFSFPDTTCIISRIIL